MAAALANVILGANRLIPQGGQTTVAHSTRQKVLDWLNRAQQENGKKRTMIVDISALVWNFDTYAIVGGSPSPVSVRVKDKAELASYVKLVEDKVVEGVLIPKTSVGHGPTWMPKGATLKEENAKGTDCLEFVFEPEVDPNNDRLELWEQEVTGETPHLEANRAIQANGSIRNMMRFFELDRVICWDLSWGAWDVVRDSSGEADMYGFPRMLVNGEPYPELNLSSKTHAPMDCAAFNALATPITTTLLREHFHEAAGYYLQGGSTYTMALFHNMWSQQEGGDHKQLLRDLLAKGELFYLGHSAGAIMSGDNILCATWKCIDAFSQSVQPYNAPYVRLPPSESADTFYVRYAEGKKNDLSTSRHHMLSKMRQYDGWSGFSITGTMLTFPHYDARPAVASFPQSAETYLRATDKVARHAQPNPSFLICGAEPADVRELRERTNDAKPTVLLIANGHAIVISFGESSKVLETCSPEEEGQTGPLHWDTYMPPVPSAEYKFYADEYESGRTQFTAGAISGTGVAGDRREDGEWRGARVISRLKALGLPHPEVGEEGLFRKSSE
eukprot:TRINITY_DN15428_c0_g6_i1.p1 TRINITY_DN15428_c0_g6~~TRINITY_DN15428_c0_g6_i1.p1  ORF type:complete len:559 (-),score=62.53 TRINITY_DN15428_c0_g6_i1:91-1767(-)